MQLSILRKRQVWAPLGGVTSVIKKTKKSLISCLTNYRPVKVQEMFVMSVIMNSH